MREKIKKIFEDFKSDVRDINPKSPKVIIVVLFSVFLVFAVLLRVGSVQESKELTDMSGPTPTLTPGRDYMTGQIVAKFKEGVTDEEINQILSKFDARIKSKIEGINAVVIEVPAGEEIRIQKELSKDPSVEYSEPDFIGVGGFRPNDTDFGLQYGLSNTGQTVRNIKGTPGADIKAEAAWDVTRGNGVRIAVLDSGIDAAHPDLAGKVVAQRIFTTSSMEDKNGHGTHVAGIAAANTNNSRGIAGTCPDCTIMVGKVLDDSGSGSYSNFAAAMRWASDNGAKVIVMSIWDIGGSGFSQLLQDAANYSWGKGTVVISIAGNGGNTTKHYPGALANVVSVANTDNNDKRSSSSSYGTWVNVAAPGTSIYSTLPTYTNSMKVTNYGYLSGTSMAAPMVAGVAGLVWASPHGTSNQAVVNRLFATADKIPGTGTSWQHGRINAAAAVGAGGGSGTVVQGIKVIGVGSSVTGPGNNPPSNAKVVYTCCQTGISPQVTNPYAFAGLTPGLHRIAVSEIPSGWSLIGYTLCYDSTTCHSEVPKEVQLNPDEGPYKGLPSIVVDTRGRQFADLWWHFKSATTTIAPTNPVPTFVCGGSPNAICYTPTPNPTTVVTPATTLNPTRAITQSPQTTLTPAPTTQPNSNQDSKSFVRQIFEKANKMIEEFNKKYPFLNIKLLPLP